MELRLSNERALFRDGWLMDYATFHSAACGDLEAQRRMISNDRALDYATGEVPPRDALLWRLFWARMIATRGALADLEEYALVLFECQLDAQARGDANELRALTAELVVSLDARASAGDESAALQLDRVAANVSVDVMEYAKLICQARAALDAAEVAPRPPAAVAPAISPPWLGVPYTAGDYRLTFGEQPESACIRLGGQWVTQRHVLPSERTSEHGRDF